MWYPPGSRATDPPAGTAIWSTGFISIIAPATGTEPFDIAATVVVVASVVSCSSTRAAMAGSTVALTSASSAPPLLSIIMYTAPADATAGDVLAQTPEISTAAAAPALDVDGARIVAASGKGKHSRGGGEQRTSEGAGGSSVHWDSLSSR